MSACFLTTLQLAAGRMNKADQARNAVVHVAVHIGKPTNAFEGYGLSVDIMVEGVQDENLVHAGHEVCFLSCQTGIERRAEFDRRSSNAHTVERWNTARS